MCGIAGYFHFDKNQTASFEKIQKMTDIILHRGPDGEGFFIKNNIALGHRRLSIIDLNTGHQPMYNEDKTIVVVFNGEIYNFIELREELKALGHVFQTRSDTEVLIHAYEQWGINCQQKFNGCWSFALWDENKKQLILSRDRLGEKPLYYAIWNNTLIFGSEIKSIIQYGVPKEYDIQLTELYLTLSYIPSPFTYYKYIHKLKQAHYLRADGQEIGEYKYWDLPEINENNMLSDKNEVYEKFEHLLKDSIKIRMRSDVPYGAFLSGGLDSSSIVCLMSQISCLPIETFTIGFKQKNYDERSLAKEVAKRFHTNHHSYVVEPDNFDFSLNQVSFFYDEPFGDSSAIPTGYVSKFARKYVKMVLTGDGGDEALSGYNAYQGIKLTSIYNKQPAVFRSAFPRILSFLAKPLRGNSRYKLNRMENLLSTFSLSFNEKMINKFCYSEPTIIKKLLSTIQNRISIEDFFSDFMSKCTYQDDFYKLMYYNLKLSLPDEMLVKADRMSMAYSLESRIPFLDHRLIEFMVHIDKNVKMQGLERKSILKKTIGRKLPQAILHAPKRGFVVPLREWFKGNEFEDRLSELYQNDFGLNNTTIKKIVEENLSGQKDNGNFIWMLFVLKKILQN